MKSFLASRKPVFSPKQFDRLSSIFEGIGQVLFGATVIGPLIATFDKFDPNGLILGVIGSITSWMFSLWLARLGK